MQFGTVDSAMDRVSGDYKRMSQWILLLIGAVVVLAFNASSVSIASRLWHDPAMRAAMVEAASKHLSATPTAEAPNTVDQSGVKGQIANEREAQKNINDLPLPLGWSADDVKTVSTPVGFILAFMGWLMTALAVSMGSPFWFDMLQRLINIRSAGTKPGTAKKVH